MAAASLCDRVKWRRQRVTNEDDGGLLGTVFATLTLWARVTELSMRQVIVADAGALSVSHSVVVRARIGLVAGDELVWRGRTLKVLRVTPLPTDRGFLACACREIEVTG